MITINTCGHFCPEPVIMTKNAVEDLQIGDKIKVIVGEEVAKENIMRFLNNNGFNVKINESQEGLYELIIAK